MSQDIFDTQIAVRRENDARMFEGALSDLVSVLHPHRGRSSAEAKEAIAEIVTVLGGSVPVVPEEITDLQEQLDYMLRPSGIMRRRVELKGTWWKDTIGCLLGSTVHGEVIALLPGKTHGYRYRGPEGKFLRVHAGNAAGIGTEAFCFYRPLPAERMGLGQLLRFMLQSIGPADVGFILAVSTAVALLGLLLPFMNKILFETVVPGGMREMLLPIAALLAGAATSATLLGIARSMILTRLQNKISLAVQSATMMRILTLPAAFFKDYSSGELAARTMNMQQLCDKLSQVTLTVGLSALFSMVYLFQIGSFTPSLLLPTVGIFSASIGLSVFCTWKQMQITRKRMHISVRLNGLIFALFSGIQKIKLAGAEKRAFARWARVYREEGKLQYTPPWLLRIQTALSALIAGTGAVILYERAAESGISYADYMAFQVAYGAASGAILAISGIVVTVAMIRPILELVEPILNAIPETSENKKIVTSLSGMIEINNLTFRYDPEGPAILDNFHLKISPGEYLAVVGKTGCGKSTLLRLLLGFEQPESGAIYYDGKDLEHLDLPTLRRNIGVVLQNSALFPADIFSNIVLTAPWKNLEDAWEAARLASLEEDIQAMPMGMHTMISEGQGGVSGGQKQRLLIARAMISRPRILFFDEATSALDNITQKRIADSIARLHCTRLVIAHRLSTIRHCDRIVVLEEGKIVEEGSYDALMARRGKFHELALRQTL